MTTKSGFSFADVLIILAIILLLTALALPRFIKVPDYGGEEDVFSSTDKTNRVAGAAATNAVAEP
jgi:hypothetical protein